jgi:hypothetical protein
MSSKVVKWMVIARPRKGQIKQSVKQAFYELLVTSPSQHVTIYSFHCCFSSDNIECLKNLSYTHIKNGCKETAHIFSCTTVLHYVAMETKSTVARRTTNGYWTLNNNKIWPAKPVSTKSMFQVWVPSARRPYRYFREDISCISFFTEIVS